MGGRRLLKRKYGMNGTNRLFLIDGHSLMFRMYYAFLRRPVSDQEGRDTSVLYGFSKYLIELIRKERPTHLAIAFDPPCKTFRHEAYPQYKANRDATPETVRDSLEPLMEIVRSLNIPVLIRPGYEADDVIGSTAVKWAGNGFDVYIVSPDKDFGQVVSEHIFQYRPGKGGDDEILGVKEICGKFGVKDPHQVIDILAIWGDAADNVPGVKGIGEVGAKKLVAAYGSVENIQGHIDELPARQAEAFRNAADTIALSKFLVTIKTDIDTEYTGKDLELDIRDTSAAAALFRKYGFRSLLGPLSGLSGKAGEAQEDSGGVKDIAYVTADSAKIREIAGKRKNIFLITDMDNMALSVPGPDGTVLTCCLSSPEQFSDILEDGSVAKTGPDLKSCINFLRKDGIRMNGRLSDIGLMHYVLNPEAPHRIEALASAYSATAADKGSRKEKGLFDGPESDDGQLIEKAALLPRVYAGVAGDLESDNDAAALYGKIEMPLIRVLADMEAAGVKIDVEMLASYGNGLRKVLGEIETEVRGLAGEPSLNISSPVQLGKVLFEKLRIDPKARKNKNGNYSTDEETLAALAERHPIIGNILKFRAVKKLLSTYIEPLPALISPTDGKIHTTFNQALTATGRLSSSHPNLQNIPIRTELGREIRKAFIPSSESNLIISADYSQIELRLMAALSGDPYMIEAFMEGRDIHAATAARIFKIPESEVTREQRGKAKTANFGIIYGISAFGLSQRLGIPRTEASSLIDEYFRNYPSVAAYIGRMKETAREKGYVETLFKRKRYLKDINSRNATVRGFAERNAVNAPIQGSAADIIKIAMINVDAALKREGLKARMILQVHDELVFDSPEAEARQVMEIAVREMEGVGTGIGLPVRLSVECNSGKNWLDAH